MTERSDAVSEGIPAGGLNEALGIAGFERPADDHATAIMPVTESTLQPFGVVHGGAFAALAETVTSRATYEEVGPASAALGQSNDTSFLRPVSSGVVHADARAKHRGRTSWVWEVEMRDDEGRLCALSRVTVAVRPMAELRPAPVSHRSGS